MSYILTSKTLDASAYAMSYSADVPENLQYLNIYSDLASVGRNLVNVGRNTVVGSPVPHGMSGGVTFSNNTNYVDSVMPETDEFTLLAAMKMPAAGDSVPSYAISNSRSDPALVSFTLGAANTATARLFYGYGSGQFLTLDIAASGLVIIIARVRTTGFSAGDTIAEVRNCTAGTSAKLAAISGMGDHVKAGAFRVGSGYSSANANPQTVLSAGLWDRYLTDDEVITQYTQLKNMYASYGVAI
ncbi:hypothetical protein [Klebsiella grimontii]|uniref:hypothetical protein n=1 Tax=Klebsiella grimontii TaxID=2058152 RepID=UPI0012B83116|nr:hypothetical protein [Klebsiella grimontii]